MLEWSKNILKRHWIELDNKDVKIIIIIIIIIIIKIIITIIISKVITITITKRSIILIMIFTKINKHIASWK